MQVSAKNWWSATTGRVRKTLDNKRAKIREEVSEGDGWPRDMVWKREMEMYNIEQSLRLIRNSGQ